MLYVSAQELTIYHFIFMKIILTPVAGSAVDPVCGMTVNPATAAGKYDYNGTTYYFCNPGCLTKFKADPEKYLAPVAVGGARAAGAGGDDLHLPDGP